jgi:hypothetical protein
MEEQNNKATCARCFVEKCIDISSRLVRVVMWKDDQGKTVSVDEPIIRLERIRGCTKARYVIRNF